MRENEELSDEIKNITSLLKPVPAEISVAVIDLTKIEPEIAGLNLDNFIYPASIYKIFIAAEGLRQIEVGSRKLLDKVTIEPFNVVDKGDPRFFPRSTHRDNRPLLKTGDRVTVDYLLDLMLSRSDNTAANTLLDLIGRESVNTNLILPYSWQGSEVTRKFLSRLNEDKNYQTIRPTVSCARHLVEFFTYVERGNMVSSWVSEKLKEYFGRRNYKYNFKETLYLRIFNSYYGKAGWFGINYYKWNLLNSIRKVKEKGYAVIKYSGEAGVVKGKYSHYAVAILCVTKTKWPWMNFPLRQFSKELFELMESKHR